MWRQNINFSGFIAAAKEAKKTHGREDCGGGEKKGRKKRHRESERSQEITK